MWFELCPFLMMEFGQIFPLMLNILYCSVIQRNIGEFMARVSLISDKDSKYLGKIMQSLAINKQAGKVG